ncbi:hypothetical protein JKG47_08785 [Acidithiobacillus sp. MC6.1]|nr:hypothetical protein [Acidithiobacillus sp. MC6.1]
MSMQVKWLERRQEIVARARADLIYHLAYIDITDIFAIDDEDLLYDALNNQNVRQRILGEMSRDDLLSHCISTAVARAARILAAKDFQDMVAECEEIACGASSERYPTDSDVLAGLIYEDTQKHAPSEDISKDYCPWWEGNDLVFSARETSKIIAAAAHTRSQPPSSPRESACFVPHRQTGGGGSSGSDGDGDGEPPRPHSSFQHPQHHTPHHSRTSATDSHVTLNILGVAA